MILKILSLSLKLLMKCIPVFFGLGPPPLDLHLQHDT